MEVKIELLQGVYDELCKNCDDVFKHDNVLLVQKKLQHKIKSDIGLSMKVNIAAPETINRSEGGKLNRILDLRKKIIFNKTLFYSKDIKYVKFESY